MEIKILKDEKDCLDIELNNLTIAEVLRVYLVKEDVKLAAWKRENPHANPVLHIESSNPKKALKAAIPLSIISGIARILSAVIIPP